MGVHVLHTATEPQDTSGLLGQVVSGWGGALFHHLTLAFADVYSGLSWTMGLVGVDVIGDCAIFGGSRGYVGIFSKGFLLILLVSSFAFCR